MTEAEKFQSLLSASWRLRKADGLIQSKSKGRRRWNEMSLFNGEAGKKGWIRLSSTFCSVKALMDWMVLTHMKEGHLPYRVH